jgi:hypothetical protein
MAGSSCLELTAASETYTPDDWKGMAENMLWHTESGSDKCVISSYLYFEKEK